MFQDPQVAGDDLVLKHGAIWQVDARAFVCDDDHGTLGSPRSDGGTTTITVTITVTKTRNALARKCGDVGPHLDHNISAEVHVPRHGEVL